MRERMKVRMKLKMAIIAFGVICLFSSTGQAATQKAVAGSACDTSSSACINCHTNYQAMDSYGDKAAAGAAAIAG